MPTGTPQNVVDTLSKALTSALDSPAVKSRFQALGLEVTPSTPAQMGTYAKTEREKWGRVITKVGVKLD